MIGGLRHGRLRIATPGQEQTVIESGTLFAAEYRLRMDHHWAPPNFLLLVLPREQVRDAFGHDVDLRGREAFAIPHRGLAPLLWDQLDLLARHGGGLLPEEWSAALSAAAELALVLLRQHFADPIISVRAVPAGGLYQAARNYIQRHYAQPDLTAAVIATAVGCSRTQLYRVFAEAGLTIGGHLRDVRLNQARRALEAGGDRGNLGVLAFRCGYSDLSAFGKAFRRRFGMAPSAWPAPRQPAASRPM